MHKSTVYRRFQNEDWRGEVIVGTGGEQYRFTPDGLPQDIHKALESWEAAIIATKNGADDSAAMAGRRAATNYLEDLRQAEEAKRKAKEAGLAKFAQLPEPRKREAEARYEILAAFRAFLITLGPPKDKALRLFLKEYNAGKVELPDWVKETLKGCKQLSRASLYRWIENYEKQGLSGLAGAYGVHREGETQLTDTQKKFVVSMIYEHPGVLTPKLMAGLEARFVPQGVSVPTARAVSYFVTKYRNEHKSELLAYQNPDAWRSRYQFAVGSCSENIERLNQLWESDATPGDVMLMEGRYAVTAVIDVWGRRPGVLVTPTSKAQAHCTLMRSCMLEWGVPEVVRTDNGPDFTAKHTERVFDSLEIEHDLCPPFTPEAKPHIERFFHTFSHGIVELLPGFIGHNVPERKAIESKKSFAARLMKKGEIIDIKLTARKFQKICNDWISNVYMHTPHKGLDGMTPAEKVRSWTGPIRTISDVRALDILLTPAPKDGGWRTVTKKGVEANRRHYFSTEMIGCEGRRVQVLLDHSDLGRVYCFLESGQYLCMAVCPNWYGISPQDEASYMKNKQKQYVAEHRKEMKKQAKELRINIVPEEILAHRESQTENLLELPKKTVEYETPALLEAALAAADRDGETKNRAALEGKIELLPEVLAYEEQQKKVVSLEAKRRERRYFANNHEIYCWILDQIKAGKDTPAKQQWRREYETWLERDAITKKAFQCAVSIDELIDERKAEINR